MFFEPIALLIRLLGASYGLLAMSTLIVLFYGLSLYFPASFNIHFLMLMSIYCLCGVVYNTRSDLALVKRLLAQREPVSHELLEREFKGLLVGTSHSFLIMSRDESRKEQGFNDAVAEIGYSAGELEVKSKDLADNINQQSEATRSVAAAVTEISYSIEEISKRIQSAYDSAHEVNEFSAKGAEMVATARTHIDDVAQIARSTYEQLESLAKHTLQVSSMSTVIREMAEQTNLLALNAAIEAARAGEHGRGFAVVADEVRALANRSYASAKDINSILNDMQNQVDTVNIGMDNVVKQTSDSVEKANQAEQVLVSIQECSVSVADMLYAISSATEQQNGAAREISSNIESVAVIADGNNVIAQQSATIAAHLCQLCSLRAE